MFVSAQEIKKKLDELNLTLHPQDRNRKRKWFSERNIRLQTMDQKITMESPHISFLEITAHMKILKTSHHVFKSILHACKQEKIILVYEDGTYRSKNTETANSMYFVAMANIYVDRIKAERKWFKERGLIVKLVEIVDISDYVYIGPSEIEHHETKRKEKEI